MNECYGYDNQDGLKYKNKKPQHLQFFETLFSSNAGQSIYRNSGKRIMSQTKSDMWNYNGKTITDIKNNKWMQAVVVYLKCKRTIFDIISRSLVKSKTFHTYLLKYY